MKAQNTPSYESPSRAATRIIAAYGNAVDAETKKDLHEAIRAAMDSICHWGYVKGFNHGSEFKSHSPTEAT